MSGLRRVATLLGAAAMVFMLCHYLLPRLARAPGMDVVRANMRRDFDVTAYFYTELGDYLQYERALRDSLHSAAAAPGSTAR